MIQGEFYSDFDEGTSLWCVFHTETAGFAFASYTAKTDADEEATRLNQLRFACLQNEGKVSS